MHLTFEFIAALAIVPGVLSLAFDTAILEQRAHNNDPVATSYNTTDCSGDILKPSDGDTTTLAKVQGNKCHVFSTLSDNIGISFGSGTQEAPSNEITFYTNSSCDVPDSELGTVKAGGAKDPGMACLHPKLRGNDSSGAPIFAQIQYGLQWGPAKTSK